MKQLIISIHKKIKNITTMFFIIIKNKDYRKFNSSFNILNNYNNSIIFKQIMKDQQKYIHNFYMIKHRNIYINIMMILINGQIYLLKIYHKILILI